MTPPTGPQPPYEELELRVDPQPVERRAPERWGCYLGLLAVLASAFIAFAVVVALVTYATPRGGPGPSVPAVVQDHPGAPHDEAIPRTRGIEPATTTDLAHQAVVGAPQTLSPRVGREGDITHMGRGGWPVDYLAIPLGPGIRVRICGPAACRDMVSTDAGPNRERLRAGVIADVSWQRFETLCGVQARFGYCPGSWIRIGASSPTLPPTDAMP